MSINREEVEDKIGTPEQQDSRILGQKLGFIFVEEEDSLKFLSGSITKLELCFMKINLVIRKMV